MRAYVAVLLVVAVAVFVLLIIAGALPPTFTFG
jgi:hypothetical protein